MIEILKLVALAAIAINLIRILLSHYFTWTFFSQYQKFYHSEDNNKPEVSLIMPIKGIDPTLQRNIQTLCEQDYTNDYEVLFCVENSNDPAFSVIKEIVSEFPKLNYKIVESDTVVSNSYGKIKNLIAGLSVSQYNILIFLDSDVTISPSFISEIVTEFGNTQVGLAFRYPVCRGTADFIAALHNLSVNETVLHITPIFRFQKGNAAIGNTIITTRKVIEDIGGLEQFSHQITEDVPLANAIYQKGYKIQLLKKPAIIFHPKDNFVNFWRQIHRWLVTIRHYQPEAVALSFIGTFPMIWVTLFLILSIIQQNHLSLSIVLFLVISILYHYCPVISRINSIGYQNKALELCILYS